MAPHSSILAWRIPETEEPSRLLSMGSQRVGHDWSNIAARQSWEFSSVAQACLTLCDPMDLSMPCFPVHHQLLELTQTHVHWVTYAIQPSHSVNPFFSWLQSFLALGYFPISQFFASGGQSIGVSASASVLPVNTQDWSPLGWTGWISLQSMGLSRVFSNITIQKHPFFGAQLSLWSNSHIHTWPQPSLDGPLSAMSLLFNMLSRLVITFLSRSKHLLISWLQSPSAVILEPKNKVWHCFCCCPIYMPWSDGPRCHDLRFLNVEV